MRSKLSESLLYQALVVPLIQLFVFVTISLIVIGSIILFLAVLFNRPVTGGMTLLQFVVHTLPQVAIDGLVIGFLYAMIALGYTMVYGVLQFINFAHSEIFMVGAFIGVELMLALAIPSTAPLMLIMVGILLAVAAGMAGSGLLAVLIERVAYRPLRGAPRLVPLISAIGVSFFLQDAVRAIEGLLNNAFYRNYPSFPVLNQQIPIASFQIAAQHGPGDVANAAQHRSRESFNPGDEPHIWIDPADPDPKQHTRCAAQGPADEEGQHDDPIHIYAHQGRRRPVLGHRPDRPTQPSGVHHKVQPRQHQ